MMHRAHLPAYVEAVNTANRACRALQEHARPMLESLIGKVVRKKDGRPTKATEQALNGCRIEANRVGDVSIYLIEAHTTLWAEAHARASTPPIGCVYHRTAFSMGDVDDSGRLTKVAPIPTHLRCNWTVAEVEQLLDARHAAEEQAREARAMLGPFQDII